MPPYPHYFAGKLGQAISEGIPGNHHSRNSNFPVNVHGVLSLFHLNRISTRWFLDVRNRYFTIAAIAVIGMMTTSCQLLIDNRKTGKTSVVVVPTDEWDALRGEQMRPDITHDIAKEMGISKKTIYTHFNNKETIIGVVTDHVFETVCHDIDAICDLNQNPIQELYAIKKRVMQYMQKEKASPTYQLQKYYPAIYNNIKQRQFSYMQQCVVKNLNRGLEQSLYRKNIEVQFVARIYFNGITGIKEESLFPHTMY